MHPQNFQKLVITITLHSALLPCLFSLSVSFALCSLTTNLQSTVLLQNEQVRKQPPPAGNLQESDKELILASHRSMNSIKQCLLSPEK